MDGESQIGIDFDGPKASVVAYGCGVKVRRGGGIGFRVWDGREPMNQSFWLIIVIFMVSQKSVILGLAALSVRYSQTEDVRTSFTYAPSS